MYRHTQVGYRMLIVLVLLCGAIWWGTGQPLPGAVSALVVLAAWSLFGTLTIEIRDAALTCRFGPLGLVRRRFVTASLRGARAVRTSPWWGWGLRLTPRGWLWNVWGLDAVELELASGGRFLLGTDEPAALVAALRQAGVPAPADQSALAAR